MCGKPIDEGKPLFGVVLRQCDALRAADGNGFAHQIEQELPRLLIAADRP